MNLDKISLVKKFLIMIVLTMIMLALIGFTAWNNSRKAENSSNEIIDKIIPALSATGNLKAEFKEYRIAAIKFPTASPDDLVKLKENYSKAQKSMLSSTASLKGTLDQKKLEKLDALIAEYDQDVNKIMFPYMKEGNTTAAINTIRDYLVPLGNEFDKTTAELENQLSVLSKKYSEQLLEDVSPFLTMAVLLIVVLANAAGMSILSRSVRSAVSKVASEAEIISGGDLSHQISINRSDEFGNILTSLEKLRSTWHDLVRSIQEVSENVNSDMIEIRSSGERTAASAKDTENRSLTVSAAADEMVSTTADIAKNCENAAKEAAASGETTQKGAAEISATATGLQEQAEKTRHDAELVKNLTEQIQKISGIVDTVADIAAQTNLLALNAAIEAARAGNAGKGFAVVADEVRALASRTAESTQQISKMTETIRRDADLANASMNESVKGMEALRVRAASIQDLLKEITEKVGGVNSRITQIATAAEEQTAATSEIGANMQNITGASKTLSSDAADSAEKLTAAAAEARKLAEIVEKIKL